LFESGQGAGKGQTGAALAGTAKTAMSCLHVVSDVFHGATMTTLDGADKLKPAHYVGKKWPIARELFRRHADQSASMLCCYAQGLKQLF